MGPPIAIGGSASATMDAGLDRTAFAAFAVVLVGVSVVMLVAGRWRPLAAGEIPPGGELEDWALAGRRFGSLQTWFLLGGSIFTAYTFIAVPALVYGVGALGFFAVPYTIIVFQLAYVILPWLHRKARVHGWITPADAVRARFGSPSLAVAVALTGLLATMPYVALQLLGLSALLTTLGLPANGPIADAALAITFAALAVGTYRHGLRAPALVSVIKGVLAFVTTAALVALALATVGGPGPVFTEAGSALADRGGSLLLPDGMASSYLTLAIGSALALLLYPHVLLPAFAARDETVLRRACTGLLAWTALLAVVALAGLAALASGIRVPEGRAELAVPALLHQSLPPVVAGAVLAVVGIGALVPAAVMSAAAASTFASNIYLEYLNPTAIPAQVTQVARVVSIVVKFGALAFVLGLRSQDAIALQLLGGVWILQTLPALLIGLRWHLPHRYALLAGLVSGVVSGTWLVAAQGYVAVTQIHVSGHDVGIYAGLVALAVNLTVTAVLTPLLDRAGITRGTDSTGLALPPAARREWGVFS
ncbi:MAG TPA: sodium:solute symporter [Kineosporiaceae bacterium]|nr:sodium:solute symporter [Kineosporiaceae bacterium]